MPRLLSPGFHLALAGLFALLTLCHPLPAQAGERGPRLPPGAPDLVADPGLIQVEDDGHTVRVTVVNGGSRPSTPTSLRLSDRPPLQSGEPGQMIFPRHLILPGERALVVWPEGREAELLLRVRWRGQEEADSFAGRIGWRTKTATP